MPNEEVTYREGVRADIANFKKSLEDRMDSFEGTTGRSLTRIETQTTKTNGSVADANKEIAKLQYWRAYITGALALLTVMLTTAIAVAAIFVKI